MALVHGKVHGLAVHFSARGVEEDRPRFGLLAGFQNVKGAQLIGLPTIVRVLLPPSNPRNRGEVEDCVLSINCFLHRTVVPDVALNLRAIERSSIRVEAKVEECDRVTHAFEFFCQVAADEPVAPSYENSANGLSPASSNPMHLGQHAVTGCGPAY